MILTKLWYLGGWFYLSLPVFIIGYIYLKEKKKLLSVILYSGLVLSIVLFVTNSASFSSEFLRLFTPIEMKVAQTTLNQSRFAGQLRNTLPSSARTCMYISWDIPTNYLIEQLYPIMVRQLKADDELTDCDYVISQFKPVEALDTYKVIETDKNYVYVLN